LAIDPSNAEAHYVLANLAMSYDWDFSTAEREFSEALRLEPNNPTAHQWLGQYWMVRNHIPEAQTETGKALDLDPVSPIFTTARAEAYYYAHDFDSTISDAKLTLDQTPNFVLAEFWLGSAYREKKMYPESLDHFQKACKLAPDNPALLMAYGHALASAGDIPGARKILNQLTALSHKRFVPAIYLAGIYTALAEKDSAFQWLDKAVEEHDDRLIYLGVDPIADPLRSDPRFRALMKRLHLL
jgi:cytochrome c-type biogenesis protein CcmH/NrfG